MQEIEINILIIIIHFTSVRISKIKEEGYYQALAKVWEDTVFCTASDA